MNIGLVCPYDYSYPGGVNAHASYLSYYFLLMGHQVKIVAPCSKSGVKGRNKAKKYSWKNIAQRVVDYYASLH